MSSNTKFVGVADANLGRLLDVGTEVMSDVELLEVILQQRGLTRKGQTPHDAATAVVTEFGSLASLARRPAKDLEVVLTPRAAAVVSAALELGRRSAGPSAARPKLRYASEVDQYYRPRLAHLQSEVFHVACLDARNQLLRDARVSSGGFASCAVLPREVFAPALREGAVGVILVHNHPSGQPQPSSDDLALTNRLVRAGEILCVKVLDHVIVGTQGYISLAEQGRMS